MDYLSVLLAVAVLAAVVATIVQAVRRRRAEAEEESAEEKVSWGAEESAPSEEPPRPRVSRKEEPALDVAVLYESFSAGVRPHCRGCGCERKKGAAVCEVCGERMDG